MKLILFDDHMLFGSTLQSVFLDNGEVESFYFVHSKDELYTALEENAIILLDINLRKAGINDSFALAKELIAENRDQYLAFLSGYDLPMYRKKAREIGARGFFSKDSSVKDLLDGLRIIEQGGLVFRKEDLREEEKLSDTEVKILVLSAKGASRGEIASRLYISNRTVGTHLTNIFQKLEVKNITEAISALPKKIQG